MILRMFCLASVLYLALGQVAFAAPMELSEVPNNAYITVNGLDWAWANPLPASSSTFDISNQTQYGWRLPTLAELLTAPDAVDFLFAGGNVPFNGSDPNSGARFQAISADYTNAASDGAVAVPWFSNTYFHADFRDGNGQPNEPWAGLPGADSLSDQLVVRNAAVPEPASLALWSLLGVGMAGFGNYRKRRKK